MLGPHGIEMAPKPDALMLIGELGLVLMVLEAGIEVELSQVSPGNTLGDHFLGTQ